MGNKYSDIRKRFGKCVLSAISAFFALGFAFSAQAATEFVSTIDPDNAAGTDYTSLSAWEAALRSDLTAATTKVFSISGHYGTTADGAIIRGKTSGAAGTVVHLASTTGQVMIKGITGAFSNGEVITTGFGTSTLTNAGDSAIAVAKCRSTGGTADDTVDISGWTTSASNYIKIWTDPNDPYGRHLGKWDSSKYHMSNSTDNISIDGAYVTIDGLQLENSERIGNTRGILISGTANVTVSNNILRFIDLGDPSWDPQPFGIIIWDASANAWIYNNILYDFKDETDSYGKGIVLELMNYAYVYNNTVTDSYMGIVKAYSYPNVLKNNLLYNNADNYYGNYDDDSDHNLSGPDQDDAPGLSPVHSASVAFLDYANDDFHLAMGDASAKNAGADLSSEAQTLTALQKDIDLQTRAGLWDIGADETATVLYRSVGAQEGNLVGSAATVNIATTSVSATAVFSKGLPDNIGVGDAVEYGNVPSLAFINGRTSSSTFSVQTAAGGLPVATTSANAKIYRAYRFLDDWEGQAAGDVNQSISASLRPSVLVSQDLVASNTILRVPCYASGTVADVLPVTVDGWLTSKASDIKIYTPFSDTEVGASQRHQGVWDDGKYHLQTLSAGPWQAALTIKDDNVTVEGLQISSANNGYSFSDAIAVASTTSSAGITISKNIIKAVPTAVAVSGIRHYDGSGAFIITNNVIYGFTNGYGIKNDTAGSVMQIYNNTVSDSSTGISGYAGSSVTAENNAVFNNADDFAGTISSLDYNASDDLDGSHPVDISPGAAESEGWRMAFADHAASDFHIRDMKSVLNDAGTAIALVSDDISGKTRPINGKYDIGAFEDYLSAQKANFSPGGSFKMQGSFKLQ